MSELPSPAKAEHLYVVERRRIYEVRATSAAAAERIVDRGEAGPPDIADETVDFTEWKYRKRCLEREVGKDHPGLSVDWQEPGERSPEEIPIDVPPEANDDA